MRKICVISQKGGVGKTTTAVNLAAGLSREGKKTLLVDLDPQSQVESCLGSKSGKSLYNYLTERAKLHECTTPLGKDLDVMRCDSRFVGDARIDARMALAQLEAIKGYDYVIMDCAPTMGSLTGHALLYADEALIPTSTDPLGLDALAKTMTHLRSFNETTDRPIAVSRIVPTLYDARLSTCKDALRQLQNKHYSIVTDPIRTNSKLREAPQARKSIFSHAPASPGARDYAQLVRTIIEDEARAASGIAEEF